MRALFCLAALASALPASADDLPAAIAAPGERIVMTLHAVGAQIYACQAVENSLQWTLREPVAILVQNGKTVGRHFAGPSWQLDDGSIVKGKLAASAPAANPGDVAWLRIAVVGNAGRGALGRATDVQRVNTHGGVLGGPCPEAGVLAAAPYAADYLFLRK